MCYGYSNDIKLFTDIVKQFYKIYSVADVNIKNIENFGMVDNLMIDGGIFASGGIIVRKDILLDVYTDLSAFEECVSLIAVVQKNI